MNKYDSCKLTQLLEEQIFFHRLRGKKPRYFRFFRLVSATLFVLQTLHGQVQTEIIRDGTVGNPDVSLNQPTSVNGVYEINEEHGLRPGGGKNLFHSFTKFNVGAGDTALFTAAQPTENVISRVTGGDASSIHGTIASNIDQANLFLLNSAGIMFGPSARLDIKGSFYASTANELQMVGDKSETVQAFSGDPALATASPDKFGFLGQPIEISIDRSVLEVPEGETLSLIGGDIKIVGEPQSDNGDGPELNCATSCLRARGGNIQLATGAPDGAVPIDISKLEGPDVGSDNRVEIGDNVRLDVSGDQGGSVTIRAGELSTGTTEILADTGGDNSGKPVAFDVKVNETATFLGSNIRARTTGKGDGGSVKVEAEFVLLDGKTNLSAETGVATDGGGGSGGGSGGGGNGGGGGSSNNSNDTPEEGRNKSSGGGGGGNGGGNNGGGNNGGGSGGGQNQVNMGNGGDITIIARKKIEVLQESNINATSNSNGDAGKIELTGPTINVRRGSRIASIAENGGNGGNIFISASERFALVETNGDTIENDNRGSRITASTRPFAQGAAGSISIVSPSVFLDDGARISSSTSGGNDGGTLTITASERVTITGERLDGEGSSIRAEADCEDEECGDVDFSRLGDAGRILMRTPTLTLEPGTEVITNTNLAGKGGQIELDVTELTVNGAAIESKSTSAGDAGDVFIGVQSNAETIINPTQDIQLIQGKIETSAVDAGGGDITIHGNGLLKLKKGSAIDASDTKREGGNVLIQMTKGVSVADTSKILARAGIAGGDGGFIEITTDAFVRSADSEVDAKNQVIINSPETNIEGELTSLDTAFYDPSTLFRPGCAARTDGEQEGRFVVSQTRGPLTSPEEVLVMPEISDEINRLERSVDIDIPQKRDDQVCYSCGSSDNPEVPEEIPSELIQGKKGIEGSVSSLEFLQHDLKAAVGAGDPTREVIVRGRLGSAQLAKGQLHEAKENLLRGISVVEKTGDYDLAASLLNNYGNVHTAIGEYQEALAVYLESAEHARRSKQPLREALALANGARAALNATEFERAAELLDDTRSAAKMLVCSHERLNVLIHLGKTAERLVQGSRGHRKKVLLLAHEVLAEARVEANKLEDSRMESYALGNLGSLYKLENRFQEALYLTRLALVAAERSKAQESIYRWHRQEGQLQWALGRSQEAIDAYRRAVNILSNIRYEAQQQYGLLEDRFRFAVAPVYLDLVDALLQTASRITNPELTQTLLLEARSTVELLKAAELRDYFQDECIAELEAQKVELNQVAENAAVIYPIQLADRLELLVSLPSGLKRHSVAISASKIFREIDTFRSYLGVENTDDYLTFGRQLYDWLIRPYEAQLASEGIDTLVFVPQGSFYMIPMSALHDGESFLIENYAVAVTPSLNILAPKALDRAEIKVLLAGLTESVEDFPALKYVNSELEAVRQLYGGEVLLNTDFNPDRIQEKFTKFQPTIVHIASHAEFSEDSGSSFLLTHDGKLKMEELARLIERSRFREPIELLVLSACDTAIGNERAAFGLAGVAIRAGARSALGSLWSVSDEATYELIVDFYRQLQDPNTSRAQALQQAQLRLAGKTRFAHPFYWSAFLLISNWL